MALSATAAATAAATAQTRLLRFPDLHGNRIVFSHGGDLWQAPIEGGTAVRLTSARGVEWFAKYSPDGRWIAFTGQIDGDEQVYVIPADGGEPRQLTFYPAQGPLPDRWGHDNQVLGWTPDGQAVLFRSLRQSWSPARSRLYTVALPAAARTRGALPLPLPMPTAGSGAFSPDGELLVYSPLFRDFRTWKRYRGGWAQDLFVFAPGTGMAENITHDPATDRDPMWLGERIWFSSDRTGTLNLWSYDPKVQQCFQETFSTTWDVRWPSAGGPGEERVVYEKGGELGWFDCKARSEHAIAILVPDEDLLRREAVVDASALIEDFALAGGGRRAAFAARGEVLTVPREHGDVRDLTRSPGAHDRLPAFSPDGAEVAFVSDRNGEEQLWRVDHLGQTAARAVAPSFGTRLVSLAWSPDGSQIACCDKDGVLRSVAVADGTASVVADAPHGTIDDYAWSPCSGLLAFSMTDDNEVAALHVWSLADRQLRRVSRPLAHDFAPQWSGDGERLFFLGVRGFQPRLSRWYEWDFQIDRAVGVYALALRRDLGPWLPRRSDEAVAAGATAPAPAGEAVPGAPTRIDFDGLGDRVEALPIELDDHVALRAAAKGLWLRRAGDSYLGRSSQRAAAMLWFDREQRKVVEVASGVDAFAATADGEHALLRMGGRYAIADAGAGTALHDLATVGLRVTRVPAEEWWQIFHEVWRRYRDYFYVANMHGCDWEALRDRYAPLVADVRHRSDLNHLLGEMVAELDVGHAYVSGGDLGAPPRVGVALLGAELSFDANAGLYRIARVLRGENDDPELRSPLTEVGTAVADGEFLFAIDGEELQPQTDPYRLLRGKLSRSVRLLVGPAADRSDAREIEVVGRADEGPLHYFEQVRTNRQRVAAASNGTIGYLHLPDMGRNGIREFVKQYYPQRDKLALIVDDRGNGGGNISQMLLHRLQRQLLLCTFGRTTGFTPYPRATFRGHLACLLDETSASDGDIFPAMFRRAGLGPLIGKRSWGGIIGIADRGPLLDGGSVSVPEFGNTEPGSEWTIEGVGVEPDIVVENDVQALLAGRDPQLDKAIEVLTAAIAASPRPQPTAPPPPIKTR